jgi:extradiol dioxygenase family protein
MHSLFLLFALLAVATRVLAAPALGASLDEDAWEQCKARLNGQLPYYVPPTFQFSGNVRRYYVAAEVDTWDYAPTGKALPEDHRIVF